MVTARSLRRAMRRNPTSVKAAAGLIAGVVGMSAAAYGVTQFIQPYKGNGARSAADHGDIAPSPTGSLVASILELVPADTPVGGLPVDEGLLYSIAPAGDFVLSIVDGVQPPSNGGVTPPPGGGSGGGGNGGGGTLVPWDGTITPPPGGGGDDGGSGISGISITPPTVVTPGLGGVDPACPELAPPPGLAPNLGVSGPAPSEAEDGTEDAETGDEAEADAETSCSDESTGTGAEGEPAEGDPADGEGTPAE